MITRILLLTTAMKSNNQLFKKVEQLAEGVKQDFRAKGLVIPIKEDDGSVRFDQYKVIKNKKGFYTILNSSDFVIYDHINLPQTAIILANNLAIGKWADRELIYNDQQYGFNIFEEEQYKKIADASSKKQDWDRLDTMMIKQRIANTKAQNAKNSILISFEKFRRLR